MIGLRRTLFVAACCSAALLLSSCLEVFGLEDSDVTVSLAMRRNWESPPILHVYIEGSRPIALAGQRDGNRVERRVAPRLGARFVVLRLLSSDGDTLASTEYSQSFKRGSAHWVALVVGQDRPIGHCIGTLLAIPTSLEADTAFVMYGGLPHGAIC